MNTTKNPSKNAIITTAALIEATGYSKAWLHELSRNGILPKPRAGAWPLVATIKGIVDHLKQPADALRAARLRKVKLEGDRVELEVLREKKHFVDAREVAAEVRALTEKTKSSIQFKLIDQLPQLNAGLGVIEQRANCRRVFDEVLRDWQVYGDSKQLDEDSKQAATK